MTEITTYKCDFCGQVFDNEEECSNHECQCRYEALREAENCEPLKQAQKSIVLTALNAIKLAL